MSPRFVFRVAPGAVLVIISAVSLGTSAKVVAQTSANSIANAPANQAQAANPSTSNQPPTNLPTSNAANNPTPSMAQNANARYADAALKLAQLTLRQAVEANQRYPGTFGAITIRCLQSQVELAQSRVQAVQGGGNANLRNILLSEIDGNLKIAEAKLQNAVGGGKPRVSQSDSVPLLQLAVEVERLAAERAKTPGASLAEQLQWQIEELRHQMVQQQIEIDQLVTLIRQ